MIAAAITVSLLSARPAAADFGAGGGRSDDDQTVSAWASSNYPTKSPTGVPCVWRNAADVVRDDFSLDAFTVRFDGATIWVLYEATCGDDVRYYWIPQVTPVQLATAARDEIRRKLPPPDARISPILAVGGWVNFETWFAVTDPGVVTATAAVPGLSVIATARLTETGWSTGDGATLNCVGAGATRPADATVRAACGHTYERTSANQPNHAYPVTATTTWSITWAASNGAGGTLAPLSTTATFPYVVRELQTVGERG